MKSFVLSLVMAALLCTLPVFSDQGTVSAQPGTSAVTAIPSSMTLMLRRHRAHRRAQSSARRHRRGQATSRRETRRTRTQSTVRHGRERNRRGSRRSISREERRHRAGRSSRRHSKVSSSRRVARGSRSSRRVARNRGRVSGRHRYGRRGSARLGRRSSARHARATRRVRQSPSTGLAAAPGPTNNRRAELKRRYPEIRH
jgi:hypothetical protein